MKLMRNGAVLAALVGGIMLAGGGVAAADADATGAAIGSPGVLSGNLIQVPIDVPINACGNSINLIGALNPAFGNTCYNGGGHRESADWDGANHDGMGHWGHEGHVWHPEAKDDCK
ncbi:chaplin family protein [Streptomyces sp. NPDC008139]|uniref:chaplin n=1 Tax=Streptomyces sp. NPDC008139 TaxID=3364814 RepID=UPI0036E096E4